MQMKLLKPEIEIIKFLFSNNLKEVSVYISSSENDKKKMQRN